MKPDEVVPVLIKITSFDFNLNNDTYQIWINQKSGQPLYCLNINLIKTEKLVDHIFNFYLPESKTSLIKLNNPFKTDPKKSELLKKNYYCTNPQILLEIDPLSNDFIFNYITPKEGSHKEINFFFYGDQYLSSLVFFWRVNLFSLTR